MLDRPGTPKHIVRVHWECLAEVSTSTSGIAEAVALSCGCKVVGACNGVKPQSRWWTPEVKEVI